MISADATFRLELDGSPQRLRFRLISLPADAIDQLGDQCAGQQPEPGLRVRDERARADEKQQPREVRADPVLPRHRGWVAHSEDEVRARAPRAVDEPRDVGRIVLAVAVDRDDIVWARAERPGGAFQRLAEPCRQGHAFSAVDGELQHKASAGAQMLGRVVDRPVVDRDNGIRERHRPGDDVSASRRGVVAGNDDSDPLGHVECCQRIAFLVGRWVAGYGGDGGNGHVHKRRNGVNGDDTEKPGWRVATASSATPAERRRPARRVYRCGHKPLTALRLVVQPVHAHSRPRIAPGRAPRHSFSPFRLRFLRSFVCESDVFVSSIPLSLARSPSDVG